MTNNSITYLNGYVNKSSNKWTVRKLEAKKRAELMRRAGYKSRAARMARCSEHVELQVCPACGRNHVTRAELCRDRFCPICMWRLAMQKYAKMCKIVDKVEEYDNYKYTFVTLTVRNVPVGKLREQVLEMSNAWNKLRKRKDFTELQDGWARSVEITYNADMQTFHPHYHIIIAHGASVNVDINTLKQYFNALWRDTANLNYKPQTDVETIDKLYGNDVKSKEEQSNAVLETFKYPLKPFNSDEMPLHIFKRYVEQVKGLRMTAFGGIFKTVKHDLGFNMEDVEDGKEIQEVACESCGSQMQSYIYRWCETSDKYEVYTEVKQNGTSSKQARD